MTRSIQPARVVAAVTLGAAALLAASGCSAGQTAQTAGQKSTVDGTSGDAGNIGLRNVRLAYPDGGSYPAGATALLQFVAVNSGADEDSLVSVSSNVAAAVAVAPAGAVTSTSVSVTTPPATTASGSATGTAGGTATGTAGATASGTAGATGSATATGTGSPTATAPATSAAPQMLPVPIPANNLVQFDQGAATVQLVGLTQPLISGETVAITFTFAHGGTLTLQVPVATPLSEVPRSPVPTTTSAP